MAGGKRFTGPIHVAVCDTPAGKYEYYGSIGIPDFPHGAGLKKGVPLKRCPHSLPGPRNYAEEDRLATTGNNHGSIVEIKGQWYIFYHRQTHKTIFSRQQPPRAPELCGQVRLE